MSPWCNRLARSAVNRKVGGSSPPGDDTFGLARRKFFHYLNFIISVILLVLHCNKKNMENHLSRHNWFFFSSTWVRRRIFHLVASEFPARHKFYRNVFLLVVY